VLVVRGVPLDTDAAPERNSAESLEKVIRKCDYDMPL